MSGSGKGFFGRMFGGKAPVEPVETPEIKDEEPSDKPENKT